MKTGILLFIICSSYTVFAQDQAKGSNSNFYLTVSVKSSTDLKNQSYTAHGSVGFGNQCRLNDAPISADSIATIYIRPGDSVICNYFIGDGLYIVDDLPFGQMEPKEPYSFKGAYTGQITNYSETSLKYDFNRIFMEESDFQVSMIYSHPRISIQYFQDEVASINYLDELPLLTFQNNSNFVQVNSYSSHIEELQIFDITGSKVGSIEVADQELIDLHWLAYGTYSVLLSTDVQTKQQLFVKY